MTNEEIIDELREEGIDVEASLNRLIVFIESLRDRSRY